VFGEKAPLGIERFLRFGTAGPMIPVARVSGVALPPMKIGMNQGGIRSILILGNLVGSIPIPPPLKPERAEERHHSLGGKCTAGNSSIELFESHEFILSAFRPVCHTVKFFVANAGARWLDYCPPFFNRMIDFHKCNN
jgi:hypothetical protein